LQRAQTYVQAILKPQNNGILPLLQCPKLNYTRYGYLDTKATNSTKYFFALDIRQQADLLPRLIGSIVEAMHFLGPARCSLSVVEGHSNDGTLETLKLLGRHIEKMGAKYHFVSSDIDSLAGDRISKLAQLRNLALQPLPRDSNLAHTSVVFLNDVAICAEDILELIHQRLVQTADMTCGMDWVNLWKDFTFYDVWIARSMNGDSFFEIPSDGNWNSAWNLFWDDPRAHERFNNHRPFQVFACWNGAAVFTAKVLEKISFRRPHEDECNQGEPSLFCKDMWYHGMGRIAVVPSVNLEYSDEAGKQIKELKGYVSDWAQKEEGEQLIEWEAMPPKRVKCMKNYEEQEWLPWDESL
jgi:alpha-1,3-mannosyltransferase